MARLGSWALLRFVVLALLGPPGAGAQGKGMRGGPGAGGSSFTPPVSPLMLEVEQEWGVRGTRLGHPFS